VPAKKLYNSEEEKQQALKEAYKRYNQSEKGKEANKRFQEKRKSDPEIKEKYDKKQKEWYDRQTDEKKEWLAALAIEGRKRRHKLDPRASMVNDARKRSKQKNIEFDLIKDDLIVPEICPVLGIELFVAGEKRGPNSPSLDRVDNNKGYTKDNVRVISNRANCLKNDATIKELKAIVEYMERENAVVRNLKDFWEESTDS